MAPAGAVQTPPSAAAAVPADAPAAAAGETFNLTLEQSRAFAEQVAAPLLLTEFDWIVDYDRDGGHYNPDSWKKQPHVQIADLMNREESYQTLYDGAVRSAFWNGHAYTLANSGLAYSSGYSNGRFFGAGDTWLMVLLTSRSATSGSILETPLEVPD